MLINLTMNFPSDLVVKNLPANARDMSSISRLGRSSGGGNGNTLQYSCLGNPMDRGASPGAGHNSMTKQQPWYRLTVLNSQTDHLN